MSYTFCAEEIWDGAADAVPGDIGGLSLQSLNLRGAWSEMDSAGQQSIMRQRWRTTEQVLPFGIMGHKDCVLFVTSNSKDFCSRLH